MNFQRFILVSSNDSSSNVLFLVTLYLLLQPNLNNLPIYLSSFSSFVNYLGGSGTTFSSTGVKCLDLKSERALLLFPEKEIFLLDSSFFSDSSSFSDYFSSYRLYVISSSFTTSPASSCYFSMSLISSLVILEGCIFT